MTSLQKVQSEKMDNALNCSSIHYPKARHIPLMIKSKSLETPHKVDQREKILSAETMSTIESKLPGNSDSNKNMLGLKRQWSQMVEKTSSDRIILNDDPVDELYFSGILPQK